jgi:hypothetical protein
VAESGIDSATPQPATSPNSQWSQDERKHFWRGTLGASAYFHSQILLFVFPSASASYSKTPAIEFKRLSFGESL